MSDGFYQWPTAKLAHAMASIYEYVERHQPQEAELEAHSFALEQMRQVISLRSLEEQGIAMVILDRWVRMAEGL